MFCWVCGNSVAEFLLYGIPPRPGRCPHCGAKPRNRTRHWYLHEVVRARLAEGSEVLEVGGSRIDVLETITGHWIGPARYTLVDTRTLGYHATIAPPHRFIPMDVSRLDFPDDTFDVILCNHTLPYVRDDRRALREILRCLRPDGLAMLDVPRNVERTQTAQSYRHAHPELGDDWFAENGDQWVYGRDFPARLEAAGFTVRIDVPFAGHDAPYLRQHGLKARAELVIGFKSAHGAARFPLPTRTAGSAPHG